MIGLPSLASLRFGEPAFLALLAVALLALLLALRRARGDGGGLLFSSLSLLPGRGQTWRVRWRWLLAGLRLGAAVLLVLALARPQAGHAVVEIPTEGIDIALALDTSSSMTARDFGDATRIEASKRVMHDFLGGLRNDRVAIVLFSAEAMVLSPLTLDYAASQEVVAPVEAGRMLRDGTAIGTGLATAVNLLRDSRAKSKVIVLLTDGQNNSGQIGPLDAAQLARLLEVRVYVIGAVPVGGGREGSVDERQMRRVSELTGGQYYRAEDEGSLLEIYREIEQLEKTRLGAREFISFEDAYLPFLLAGAALLLVELLLAASAFRRSP
ncbi:MAG: VWA domain-containing protein [Candidatus Limnocylindria bacterium]